MKGNKSNKILVTQNEQLFILLLEPKIRFSRVSIDRG